MSLLNISNLNVEFSSKEKTVSLLKNISLSVEKGEFVALVGESGSGKTMTSLSIMNLLPENVSITSGTIEYGNKKPAMIFQEPMTSLNPLIKVGKQIAESGIIAGMSKKEAFEKAEKIARQTGLEDTKRIFNCYPHELSGGMRQRVMIASALMTDPELLIADEPTTALDVTTQEEILNIISSLNRNSGTSLLLITHDLSIVKKICQRTYVMYKGQIVESGKTEEILTNPQHEYTKALINAIPSYEKRNSKLPTIYSEEDFK